MVLARRGYTWSNLLYGMLLGSLSFPVLIQASIAGLRGKRARFTVTPKEGSSKLSWWALWPWHLLIGLNGLAILVGAFQVTRDPYAIGVNMLWCAYHILILSCIYRLNEDTRVVHTPSPLLR